MQTKHCLDIALACYNQWQAFSDLLMTETIGESTMQTGMTPVRLFTAIIERDEDWYVALCPELDIASQGQSIEEARENLIEAITLFFEVASPSELEQRTHSEVFITQVGVPIA